MSFSWHVSKSGLLTLQHWTSSRLKRLVPPDRYLGGVSESAWEIEASVSRLGNARVEYRPSTQGTHARHGAAVLALTPACAVKGTPPVSTADAVAALPAVDERSQQHDEKAREHRGSTSEILGPGRCATLTCGRTGRASHGIAAHSLPADGRASHTELRQSALGEFGTPSASCGRRFSISADRDCLFGCFWVQGDGLTIIMPGCSSPFYLPA